MEDDVSEDISTRRERRARRYRDRTTGRAGRNLPVAIGVGLGIGVVAGVCLFTFPELFVGFVTVAVVLALWELTHALSVAGLHVPLVPSLAGSVGIVLAAWIGGAEVQWIALCLAVGVVALWRALEPADGAVRDIAAGIFVLCYLPFLASFALLLLRQPDGPWRVLVFLVCVIANDVAGFGVGAWLGRHPMAPSVSPKKSWEGMAGSAVFGLLGAAVLVPLTLGGTWWAGLAVGAAVVAAATVGDLSESLVKRDLGIKDMGWMLPGHGGIMDRLDSMLPAAAVSCVVLTLLVPGAAAGVAS